MTGKRLTTPLPFGICEICGRTGNVNRDHNHETGVIRGVLCISCNMGLARFKDDAELVRAALNWLLTAGASEQYMDWMRERRTLAHKRAAAVALRKDARADRYRERYQTDPEYREEKLAQNRAYFDRAGIS